MLRELAPTLREEPWGKSRDLPSASWRVRRAGGGVRSEGQGTGVLGGGVDGASAGLSVRAREPEAAVSEGRRPWKS